MDDCCPYFCTGLSIFGVAGLLFITAILKSGGAWFLGLAEHDAEAAASATLAAACIYMVFLVWCGMKLKGGGAKKEVETAEE